MKYSRGDRLMYRSNQRWTASVLSGLNVRPVSFLLDQNTSDFPNLIDRTMLPLRGKLTNHPRSNMKCFFDLMRY